MSSHPAVSAVIPAYNAAGTVRQAIGSVLGQSVGDLEVIVVDDGSEDATADVVSQLDDPRIRLISQANAGVAAARNAGIKAAGGQFVAFLDADDLWLPHKLAAQLDAIGSSPGSVAAQSSVFFVDDDLHVLSIGRCRRFRNQVLDVLAFQNTPGAMTTLVADREFLLRIGQFDESLVILEDWELMIRIARHGGLVNVEEPLALYRVHPGNRSKDLEIHIEPGFRVLDRLFADPDLPAQVRDRRAEVYARFYTMLAGGAFNGRRWGAWARWSARAVRTHPRMIGQMASMPYRRLRRRVERATRAAPVPSAPS